MRLSFNPNIVKTSHPFSALMGTINGIIIAWKFLGNIRIVYELALIFGLAQVLTGMINDYLDLESDLVYQPLKITSRGGITKEEIKPFIIINILLLVSVTIYLFSVYVMLIIFTGISLAQSYNFGLKDTLASGLIFVSAFGMMAITPYYIKFGYSVENLPYRFIFSGLILALSAHITNDLVDYEIDIKRDSRSMTLTLGRLRSIYLIVFSFILLIFIQSINIRIFILSLLLLTVLIFNIRSTSYHKREFVYYFLVLISSIILYLIPIN